ncbi:MAG: PP-loop family protein [Desulfovibrionaceae bacterium]|nr:PP-loop family protein [Desulfovibrionaceae bacterium]
MHRALRQVGCLHGDERPGLAVAFSGGLDSRFLCHAARLCGYTVLALHVRGPHIPPAESKAALDWARVQNVPVLTAEFDPLSLPEVAGNSRERCYACKRGLIQTLQNTLAQSALACGQAPLPVCDGSNADDMRGFRPGLRALAEAGVHSPLAAAGLSKAEIRALAAATGLDRPEQQARPCLLTRLAYGLTPDAALLARLADAETALAALPGMGDFRLRLTPAPVLQLAALPAMPQTSRRRLEAILEAHGFAGCAIRVTQQVSGFFDA